MARLYSYEDAVAWIEKQTKDISQCRYGRNRQSLWEGLDEQRKWSKEIDELDPKFTQIITRTFDNAKKQKLQESYEKLKATIDKKIHCLETMLQVAALEENCSRVSRDFDIRSVSLVKSEKLRANENDVTKCSKSTDSLSSLASVAGSNIPGFIATNAQDCINGLRSNWNWVVKLVQCIGIHLKNSSDYQQFFHEVCESEPWMLEDFNRFSKVFDSQTSKSPENKDDAKKLAADLDSIYISLRQWEAKTNRLLSSASTLVPVPLRTDGIREPTPAISLADYETKDISFAVGEDLLLLDNSSPDSWKVRNGKGEEAEVPPVILLIPGPCKEAIETATKLQLQLLTTWTNALKRIGVRLLCHMLTVFKPEYNTREIAALSSMEDIDKDHLLQLLSTIEDTLKKHWSDHEGFVSLQERLLALRMALEEIGDGDQRDAELYKALIIEIGALGQIMNIYQDMFKDWEKLKATIETSRAPELMLIVDKWEQLQFVSRDYFSKFWKSKLPLDERERSIIRGHNFTLDGISFEDTISLLSPRSDSARVSMESLDSIHRPDAANVARRLNLDVDDVFHNDSKTKSTTLVTSVVEKRQLETVDGEVSHRQSLFDKERAEETMQKMLGRATVEEDGWKEGGSTETRTITETVTVMGNRENPQKVSVVKPNKSAEDWSKESGFHETNSVTKTITVEGNRQSPSRLPKASESKESGFLETNTVTKTVTVVGNRDSPVRVAKADESTESWSKESGFNEMNTVTKVVTVQGNRDSPSRAAMVKANESTMDWSKDSGYDEINSVTTTITVAGNRESPSRVVKAAESRESWRKSNGVPLRYVTQTEERNGRTMEELNQDEMTQNEFSETRSRMVITDGVTYGKATAETAGRGEGKRESPARTIRRLEPSQSEILSKVEETGFEELKDMEFNHQNRLSSSEYEGTKFGIASETKIAETEQLSSAEMEENKTFVIRSVINPNDHTDISLQDAILMGVIRPTDGIYMDSSSGSTLPIATAMSDGLIKVMFSTTKRSPEKFSSIGIITVKTIRRMARPCIIVSVRDTRTNETLSQDQALRKNLLDEQQGTFTDSLSGRKMMIAEAVEKGLMVVEFCGEQPEPEVISKTYAVRAVVDRRLKKTVTFHEAVRRGIIDKESGGFRDTMTNEKMYVGDAIMRGFLKARLIEDAHGLNIDPENKMVIDKTQKIRDRLLKPLKVISAFKMAAKDAAGGKK